jgi:hypothetical protein
MASSYFGIIYTVSGFMLWLCLEAVQRISRITRATITIFAALSVLIGIYLSAYVWTSDTILADLNGVDNRGTVKKYYLWRICFINLGVLMAGSLYTMVRDWQEGEYMVLVTGFVPRQAVLDLESVMTTIVGDSGAQVTIRTESVSSLTLEVRGLSLNTLADHEHC